MSFKDAYTVARERMVQEQLIARGIDDERVLEAMRMIPRHLFVSEPARYLAYDDGPLKIGQRQTISQPYIVALMSQLLLLKGEEKVLEIGTGSGYQAAVLAALARDVYSIEQYEKLAAQARAVVESLAITNLHLFVGDGSTGLPAHAPYDAIICTAAAPEIPAALFPQLADGGRLVLPVGDVRKQILWQCVREGNRLVRRKIVPVAFVPLRGKEGWSETKWKY